MFNIKKYTYSFIVCILFLASTSWTGYQTDRWVCDTVIGWDVAGYYAYLPAVFIYKDVKQYDFYKVIDNWYKPSGDRQFYALDKHAPSGNRLNKYTLGVSYFEVPFFFLAHWYAGISDLYPSDGYSSPYQTAVLFSTILFVFLGFLILRKFLLEYGFKDVPIALSLLVLGLATNLFHYTAILPGMGHPYSFFLYACILFSTQRLFTTYHSKYFIMLGLSLGLAILIRPVDILVVIPILFWHRQHLKIIYPTLLTEHLKSVLLALACLFIVWIPQLLYWKYVTGSWFIYSYGKEGFDFTQPEIIKGLFSYRKGWFIYTPIAFISFASLVAMVFTKKYKRYAISTLCFYLISFYIIFSWHQWYYGGSFGARILINSLPLLAIPTCVLANKIIKGNVLGRIAMTIILVFSIGLNLFQSDQYNRGVLHWDSMSKEYYWRIFLKE